MKDGYQICLEVAREADAKYPQDKQRALDFARVKAKRELGIGPDTHPWVVEQIMPVLSHAINMARSQANRNLIREREQLPAKSPESCSLSMLPPERPKNLRPAIVEPVRKARLPDRTLTPQVSELVGAMARRIEGKALGTLRGADLPAIIAKGRNTLRGVAVPVWVLQQIHNSGRLRIDQEIREVFSVEEVDILEREAESKLPGQVELLLK